MGQTDLFRTVCTAPADTFFTLVESYAHYIFFCKAEFHSILQIRTLLKIFSYDSCSRLQRKWTWTIQLVRHDIHEKKTCFFQIYLKNNRLEEMSRDHMLSLSPSPTLK